MSDEIRRCYVERQTPTERAIRHATHMVEALGADPALTDAVRALQTAFDAVADWQDEQAPMAVMEGPDASPGAIDEFPLMDAAPSLFKVKVTGDGGRDITNQFIRPEPVAGSNVAQLTTVQQAGVIATLENFLAQAHKRQITGIAIVAVDIAGYVKSAYEQGHSVVTLIGGTEILKRRLLEHFK